jgi:hypothetical protein
MAKKRRKQENAWARAKKLCRLNASQLEMARALDMDPHKLPGLRPSPHQKWKLPVCEFIEQCYRERFDVPEFEASPPTVPRADRARALGGSSRVRALAYYLEELVGDLFYCSYDRGDSREALTCLSSQLRAIADALDRGDKISEIPRIPLPSPPAIEEPPLDDDRSHTPDDDIPF